MTDAERERIEINDDVYEYHQTTMAGERVYRCKARPTAFITRLEDRVGQAWVPYSVPCLGLCGKGVCVDWERGKTSLFCPQCRPRRAPILPSPPPAPSSPPATRDRFAAGSQGILF